MVDTWALKGLPYHDFGVYVYAMKLHRAFGLVQKHVNKGPNLEKQLKRLLLYMSLGKPPYIQLISRLTRTLHDPYGIPDYTFDPGSHALRVHLDDQLT